MEPFWLGVLGGAIIGLLLVVEKRTAESRKKRRAMKKKKMESLTFREKDPQTITFDIITKRGYEQITINMPLERFITHLKALAVITRD